MRRFCPCLHLICWMLLSVVVCAEPRHLYLTWDNEDTARTQTVVFHTLGKATEPRVEVFLQGGAAKATTLAVKTVMLGGTERRIHSLTLKSLKPSTVYKFRAGDNRYGMSPWRSFRTMPADDRSVKIATGGDMYRHPETVELLKAAALYKPDVALIGAISLTPTEISRKSASGTTGSTTGRTTWMPRTAPWCP